MRSMFRLAGLVVATTAAVVAARADKPSPGGGPPADRVKAIEKEYADARQAFNDAYRQAKTDDERQRLVREKSPRLETFTGKLLKLAQDHPNDPAAIDALVAIRRLGGTDERRAVEMLVRDHVKSEKLAAACLTLSLGHMEALRTILKESPHREVQCAACYSLARALKNRANGQADDPEAEALFERVVNDYADVVVSGQQIGRLADRQLFELRHLAVGKVAPDIEGEDIDGVKFKLSDYRGKVVLLDFWGHW
jgi:AhpC/TSA family